jgi:hypothetical protein
MHYLAEDPWPLAGALGLVALALLIALRTTQQGKYLIWAGIVAILMLGFLAIERFWVTDNERIEKVIYDVAAAVEAGDAVRVSAELAPDARVSLVNSSYDSNPYRRAVMSAVSSLVGQQLTEDVIKAKLANYRFDFIKVSGLRTHVSPEARMGTAEFRVHVMGEQRDPFHAIATPASGMSWSFGLRETAPGVWKITRITPTSSLAELNR